jgi:uncharacterized protein involved in response to NO
MAERWDWRLYVSAPQRLFFIVGAIVHAAAALWWAGVHLGVEAPRSAIAPVVVHALVMTFGFFPMFFAGFCFSTGVKWLRVPALPMASLAPAAIAHAGGWSVVAAAVAKHDPTWMAGGLALAGTGWAYAVARLALLIRSSREEDRTHPTLFALAGTIGVAGMHAAAATVCFERWDVALGVARASVWGFVGITFLAAADRMIPFLSATPFDALNRKSPKVLLSVLAGFLVAKAFAEVLPAVRAALAPIEVTVGAALLLFALRWPFVQSLRPAMLRMLYTGFVWLGVGFLLSGLDRLVPRLSMGTAALHAFTAGFLGTTMLAMLSRVAAGQAGRSVVVDRWLGSLFVLLQVAVAARVAPSVLFAATGMAAPPFLGVSAPFLGVSAVAWACLWFAWAVRYGHLLGARKDERRPR